MPSKEHVKRNCIMGIKSSEEMGIRDKLQKNPTCYASNFDYFRFDLEVLIFLFFHLLYGFFIALV